MDIVVVSAETYDTLEGLPTPRLLDACNDGKAHEAWPNQLAPDFIQWRLRDDRYDAEHKPADVPYTRVFAGRSDR